MTRAQQITHKGKTIYSMNFSGLSNAKEIRELIIESASFIRSQPKTSLLTLTNINGMYFNNEVRDLFNDFLKGNKPYVRRSSVIGLNGLQQILYNGLMKITGRDVKSFPSESAALEWLISLD